MLNKAGMGLLIRYCIMQQTTVERSRLV